MIQLDAPVIGRFAVEVHGGALLVGLHHDLAGGAKAVAAEIGLGQLRVDDVVVARACPQVALVHRHLGWQPLCHFGDDGAQQRVLLPQADALLQSRICFETEASDKSRLFPIKALNLNLSPLLGF